MNLKNRILKIVLAAVALQMILPLNTDTMAGPDDNSFGGQSGAPELGLKKRPIEKPQDLQANEALIKDAEVFFKTHAPNHLAAYRRYMERGKGQHINLRTWIVSSYMDLRAVENADPKLYEIKLDELKIQDDIFGKVTENRSVNDKKLLREDLKPLMKDLLKKKKQASALRIEKLKVMIENEKKFLSIDPTDDKIISSKVEEEIDRGARLFNNSVRDGRPPIKSGNPD